MKTMIPNLWKTERLLIRDAILAQDLADLQQLYEKCAYIGEWDGKRERRSDYMKFCLTVGDLPPKGVRENLRIQAIFNKETEQMIGFHIWYLGYPTEDVLWITFFFIDPTYQSRGFGQEAIRSFLSLTKEAGISKLQLAAALKNWPALRFWTMLGFDKVMKITGDRVYSENAFAHIVLECQL